MLTIKPTFKVMLLLSADGHANAKADHVGDCVSNSSINGDFRTSYIFCFRTRLINFEHKLKI